MTIPGSETYKSVEEPEMLPRETAPSEGAVPPESIQGDDWPADLEPPLLDGLNPDSIAVPGPDAYIVIHGKGFTPESVVSWDEDAVPCEFVNEGKLRVLVTTYSIGIETLPLEIPVAVEVGDKMSNTLMFTYEHAEVRSKKGRKDSKGG